MFQVGDEVVCVEQSRFPEFFLDLDVVYTVTRTPDEMHIEVNDTQAMYSKERFKLATSKKGGLSEFLNR